jgi:hypothetical protein
MVPGPRRFESAKGRGAPDAGNTDMGFSLQRGIKRR